MLRLLIKIVKFLSLLQLKILLLKDQNHSCRWFVFGSNPASLHKQFISRFKKEFLLIYKRKQVRKSQFNWGSGCGSVGRAVTSDFRGPLFQSSHWQNLS